MDAVKVKYVGPGSPQDQITVTAAEADALEERGLWKRVTKYKSVVKKKEISDG